MEEQVKTPEQAPSGPLGATAILLMGDEGTGKSTSLETLPPEDTIIIQPNTKDLPWAGWESQYTLGKNLLRINTLNQAPLVMEEAVKRSPGLKYLVVEDTTHLQNERTTSAAFIAQNSGNAAFNKWNVFGADFGRMITQTVNKLPKGLIVIFIAHTELKDDGQMSIQTAGKLLDNSIKIPSYFTYVLQTRVLVDKINGSSDSGTVRYVFQTNHDGTHKAKTPKGCFSKLYIDNDMKAVVDRIQEYRKNKVKS